MSQNFISYYGLGYVNHISDCGSEPSLDLRMSYRIIPKGTEDLSTIIDDLVRSQINRVLGFKC